MPVIVKFDPNNTQQQAAVIPDASRFNDGVMTKEQAAQLAGLIQAAELALEGELPFTLTDDGFGVGEFVFEIDASAFVPGTSDGGGPPSLIRHPLLIQWFGTLCYTLDDGSDAGLCSVFFGFRQTSLAGASQDDTTFFTFGAGNWQAPAFSITTLLTPTSALSKLQIVIKGPTVGLTGKVAWNLTQTAINPA